MAPAHTFAKLFQIVFISSPLWWSQFLKVW